MNASEHELMLRQLEDAIVTLESQLSTVTQDKTDPERVIAQLVFTKLAALEARRERFLHESRARADDREPVEHEEVPLRASA
jgi:hypothetical protein